MGILKFSQSGEHKRSDVKPAMPNALRRGLQATIMLSLSLALVVSTNVFGDSSDAADVQLAIDSAVTIPELPGIALLSFSEGGVEEQSIIVEGSELELTGFESSITGVKAAPKPVSRSVPRVAKYEIDRSVSYAHLSPILAEGEKYRGTPYGFAGKGPKTFDCSGYTSYVMKQLGLNITSASASQKSVKGAIEVSAADAQPGDLMWWPKTKTRSGHVAFYVKPGIQLDSSTFGKPVDYRRTSRDNPRFFRLSHLIP